MARSSLGPRVEHAERARLGVVAGRAAGGQAAECGDEDECSGKAPESQVWTFDNAKKFDENGKVARDLTPRDLGVVVPRRFARAALGSRFIWASFTDCRVASAGEAEFASDYRPTVVPGA